MYMYSSSIISLNSMSLHLSSSCYELTEIYQTDLQQHFMKISEASNLGRYRILLILGGVAAASPRLIMIYLSVTAVGYVVYKG